MTHVLIVDDDADFTSATQQILQKLGHEATVAGSVEEARAILTHSRFDLLILDIMLPDGSGLQVLETCDEDQLESPIALVTGHPSVKSLVKSLYGPNITYLTKPLNLAKLRSLLPGDDDEGAASGDDNANPAAHFGFLIGESEPMKKLYQIIERVANTSANILLQGESGVGKELVARAIHAASTPSAPFVATNCGALPRELVGSELFGHEKGAFTGAVKNKRGLFERANGGTLFLDEVTEMPLEQQPILLRVLETKTVVKVGGTEEIPVDCRVISATNRDLDNMVDEQCLREDLYFRLAVFPVTIPPLRERGDDIKLLAQYFLQCLNEENATSLTISEEQLETLAGYEWMGNVRELRHAIHRAHIMSDRETGRLELPQQLASPFARTTGHDLSEKLVGSTIEDVERQLITMTLEHCRGNKKETADVLGISLKTLYNRLNKYSEAS
ncbi:MAG: sigma-54 dependent transcriptional regulator [Halioglobus sp.]